MLAQVVAYLKTVELFAGLEDETLKVLARSCRRRRFGPRTTLFHQDDPGQTLYIIASGNVSIQTETPNGDVVHIAQRVEGEHFGELSLLDGKPRSADAVTGAQPTDLVMLDREAFLNIIEQHPVIARNVIQSLAGRLRDATAQTTTQQRRNVGGRLAAFLLERAGIGGLDGLEEMDDTESKEVTPPVYTRIALGMTQLEIGSRIGASRETVTRILARLEQDAIIERRDGQIILRNLPYLRSLSG